MKLFFLLVFLVGNASAATRNFIPRGAGEGDIGLSTRTWRSVWANNFYGDGSTLTGVITSTAALQDDIDSRVLKAGDTMTGDLTIEKANAVLNLNATSGVGVLTLTLGGVNRFVAGAESAGYGLLYLVDNSPTEKIFLTASPSGSNTNRIGHPLSVNQMISPTRALDVNGGGIFSSSVTASAFYGDGSGLTGVIQSTATGSYALRVATATYLATAPGACSSGEFISALTADGTKTCAAPAGGGDAVLASTQTWTGVNTLNQVFISSLSLTGMSSLDVYRSASYNHPSSAWTIIKYDTKNYDALSEYSTTTSSFTATSAGKYLISATFSINSQNTDRPLGVAIIKNLTSVAQTFFTNGGAINNPTLGVTKVLSLVAGDTIAIHGYYADSVVRQAAGGESLNYLSIERIK